MENIRASFVKQYMKGFLNLPDLFGSFIRKCFAGAHGGVSQENRLILLGFLAIIGFPLYYWIWAYLFPQPYENLLLRVVGMVIAFPFFWARKIYRKKWFDVYFFVAITYIFPTFFTFMYLMNYGSAVWAESLLIAVIVLFHFDSKFALISFCVGTICAYVSYVFLTGNYELPQQQTLTIIPISAFAILSVSIVKIGRNILVDEKLQGMSSALGIISHELRTPLRSVDASARGFKRYFPLLVASYEKNPEFGNSQALPPLRLRMMEAALDRIQAEVQYMNSSIDLLLANAGDTRKKAQITKAFKVKAMIQNAFGRYPFDSDVQRALVSINCQADFEVEGNEDLCMMIIFNLMKNALRAVARAGKGNISIVTTSEDEGNILIFRDTGCGIPASEVRHIFRRFHSYPANAGTGIGLAFVRDTLTAWGAKIHCRSEENEFTEFVLRFPKRGMISNVKD